MTANEFFRQLSEMGDEIEADKVLTISPGPIELYIGKQDVLAAKLTLWIEEQLPEDATFGDLEDVLLAALWWSHFWEALLRRDEGGDHDSD